MMRDLPNGTGYWLLGGTHSCILDAAGTIVALADPFLTHSLDPGTLSLSGLPSQLAGTEVQSEVVGSRAPLPAEEEGAVAVLRGAVFACAVAATSKPWRRMGRGPRCRL